ncbi:MAG: hypothetical protein JJE29_09060, partial [Peptostreptococcaceae bacterium]|nr:hypothetical protein [Peptostreptococcaceae bacterium]
MKSRFLSFLIVFAMLFGMVPNMGMVTAYGITASSSLAVDDLALQAVQNIYDRYQNGIDIGAPSVMYGAYMSSYDCVALMNAGVNLETWERDGTNLKVKMDDYLASAAGRNAKQLAQDYLYLNAAGKTTDSAVVLELVKAMQTTSGALSGDI